MADKKEVVRSKEAQAIIDFLQKNPDGSFTLSEISAGTGLDLKTGHLSTGRSAGLLGNGDDREIEVVQTVKKTVKTYRYTGK